MKLLSFVSEIFAPLAQVIDAVHTSTEEKLEAKRKIMETQNALFVQVLDYERAQLEAQSKIITAEAQGQSVLQRNWRPITMLTFLVLVVLDALGQLPFRLAAEAWTLLQIGLGGYVAGRSAEKIAENYLKK
jgi:hypothetical protein